jgi:hypothetical protein
MGVVRLQHVVRQNRSTRLSAIWHDSTNLIELGIVEKKIRRLWKG